MTERDLQENVVRLARLLGYRTYHTYDSRRSNPGFPDLVLVDRARRRVLFRELKTDRGRPTPAQRYWIHDLHAAGQDAAIWRPSDWTSGRIETELRGADD